MIKIIDKVDIYFFKYQIHGISYLKLMKDLNKLKITFLLDHDDEHHIFNKYKEYGVNYLKYLKDAIKLNLTEIIDISQFREKVQCTILKWVFKNLDDLRRDENN